MRAATDLLIGGSVFFVGFGYCALVVAPELLVAMTVMVLAPAMSCTGKLKLPSGLIVTLVPLAVTELMSLRFKTFLCLHTG